MIAINKDIKKALKPLAPSEKLKVIDFLMESLDESDSNIDEIWAKEAERRLKAIKSGKTKLIPYEKIFGVKK